MCSGYNWPHAFAHVVSPPSQQATESLDGILRETIDHLYEFSQVVDEFVDADQDLVFQRMCVSSAATFPPPSRSTVVFQLFQNICCIACSRIPVSLADTSPFDLRCFVVLPLSATSSSSTLQKWTRFGTPSQVKFLLK